MKYKPWNGQITSFAHQKYDGINLRVARDQRCAGMKALTRTPTNIIDDLRSCGWLKQPMLTMPCDAVVHGELYVPGHKSSEVSHALATDPQALHFAAFAVEWWGVTHDASLLTVDMQLVRWGFQTIPYLVHESLRLEGHGGIGTYQHPDELLHNLPADVEGYVMKNGNLWDWYKHKPVKTIDLFISDYSDSDFDGKYAGQVGSVHVSTIEGVEVAKISGMSDEIRLDITENRSKYLGRVCEVRYQYVGARGRLRHPAFIQWRDDKCAEECTLYQDNDLKDFWKEEL